MSLNRQLWLEVVWQKGSQGTKKYRDYELRQGDVLERQQVHIEQFEVYRGEWKDERDRLSLVTEYGTLGDCFLPANC